MSHLSAEQVAELLSRLLTATRSFAYTAHYDDTAKQLTVPSIAASEAAQTLLTLEASERGYGAALVASILPEDRPKRLVAWERASSESQRTVQVRFRCLDAQGKTHWIHEEATLEGGSVVGVFSVLPQVEESPLVVEVETETSVATSARPRLLKRTQTSLRANDLEEGLAQQQFTLAYQFQLQPDSHYIVGAEVFIRWRHPEQGLLFPSRFLPQAEESGHIHLLGQWMAEAAYAQQSAWEERGFHVPLSLNISARQITHVEFARKLPRGKLRLEFTEAALLAHGDTLLAGLSKLTNHGFVLGLDNAGLGALTEAMLQRYPLRYLKIARSLVQNLEFEESLQKARRVLSLGQAQGLEVIADGVETPQQAQLLQDSGCTVLQGYLYSRPLAAEALEDIFRSGSYHLPSLALARAA